MNDPNAGMAALYDSVTETAFGPLFHGIGHSDSDEVAEAFCEWLGVDPRSLQIGDLTDKHAEFYALANGNGEFVERIRFPGDYE